MKKKGKKIKVLKVALISLLTLIILYLIAAYSSIPFIAKWRTIYIETAMSTMTHQWLATKLLPSSVVNKVVADIEQQQIDNLVDENTVDIPQHATIWIGSPQGLTEEQLAERDFLETYTEIDFDTLPDDLVYKDLILTDCEGVLTTCGDSVYTIDTVNGIIIVNITGDGYVGKLAIIKDPSRVKLATSSSSYMGERVVDIAEDNNAILAINASGFVDPNGMGNGGTPVGLVKSEGQLLQKQLSYGYWFNVGFDYDNNLRIGSKIDVETLRDAVQFRPAIIVDGEKKVEGSAGWGLQPRTILGQTATKEVLFLIIDGRRPTHSIGTTVGECADILLRYNATQAINLDGGSSSVLVYDGETITIPSTTNKNGRHVPNAWIVERVQTDEGEENNEDIE